MTELAKKVEDGRLSSILNSIQIALDHYDDIFSDFDPSPFSQRMLSDDFLKEMQKRYIETKKGEFEIRFSLPASIRDVKTEGLVKKRLKDYFHKQIKNVDVEVEKDKMREYNAQDLIRSSCNRASHDSIWIHSISS